MEAWVIKRDDGLYYNYELDMFVRKISIDALCIRKYTAESFIRTNDFKNCKPVKVRIEEVEE